MPIKVQKVAELVGSEIVPMPKVRFGDIVAYLTNLEPTPETRDGPAWSARLAIGKGPQARAVRIDLAPFLSPADADRAEREPIILFKVGDWIRRDVLFFRGRFFVCEREITVASEREEAVLRAKKIVYDEEAELKSLKSAVSNMEAALEFQRSGPRRDPIPDDVKLLVWSRDGGACVRCGSKEKLHFDHVIPVAKGGGNLAPNIQLLCEVCNLKKSDRIAF